MADDERAGAKSSLDPTTATQAGSAPATPTSKVPPARPHGRNILYAAAAALLVLAGTAFGVYWLWWRAAGPELAKYAPRDTRYYVEIPNLTKLMLSLSQVDCIDPAELDLDEQREGVADAFADSFDLRTAEADDLLESIQSIAYASRAWTAGGRDQFDYRGEESVFMVKLSSAEAMEPLLASKRFHKDGKIAQAPRFYVTRKPTPTDSSKSEVAHNLWVDLFDNVGLGDDAPPTAPDHEDETPDQHAKRVERERVNQQRIRRYADSYVWFEDEALLVVGDDQMIEEIAKVIRGDRESLATGNEAFRNISWTGGSTILEFVDIERLDRDIKRSFFTDEPRVTTVAQLDDVGLVTRTRATVSGKKVEHWDRVVPEAVALRLYEKLPAETFAYVAGSTKLDMDGKAFLRTLRAAVGHADPEVEKDLDRTLIEMEDKLGFGVDTIVDATGDQFILAAVGQDNAMDAMVGEEKEETMRSLGFVGIFQVDDEAAASKVMKNLRDFAERESERQGDKLSFKRIDTGFQLTVSEDARSDWLVEVITLEIVDDKYMVVTAGAKKRIGVIKEAFEGDGELLRDDDAHDAALDELDAKSQLLVWVDTGRLIRTYLKTDAESRSNLKKKGVPVNALVVEGEDRITSGFSIRASEQGEGLSYELVGVNYPFFLGTLTSLFFMRNVAMGRSEALKREIEAEERAKPASP